MKKLLFPILAILALWSLMGVSCGKDEPLPFVPLDREFLSYFAFPAGSWWVYEEVSTGQRDSVYIINTETEKDKQYNGPRLGTFEYEIYWQREIIRGDTLQGEAFPTENYSEEPKWIYLYYHHYYLVYNERSPSFFKDSRGADTLDSEPNTHTYIKMKADTLTLNGISYKDVIVVSHAYQQAEEPFKDIYYSKNVGVIKRVFWDGTEWELVKHHINQ